MPTVLRTETRPGTRPGRMRHVKIVQCECGAEVECASYTGSACASCGVTYNLDGWPMAAKGDRP